MLGPELGTELGVIRTEELLAARRIDGGRQFFTRAIDFGFSKDYRQTLQVWDKQEVSGGHRAGHSHVSAGRDGDAILHDSRQYARASHGVGDPGAGGVQTGRRSEGVSRATDRSVRVAAQADFQQWIRDWPAWRWGDEPAAGRYCANQRCGNRSGDGDDVWRTGGAEPVDAQIAGFRQFCGRPGRGPARVEAFQLLDGEPATKDIMDGIDTSWNRFSHGGIGEAADKLIAKFNSEDLSANVPAFLEIKKELAAAPADPIIDEKRSLLDHIIVECLGLEVETTAPQAEIVPGEAIKLHERVTLHSAVAVKWVGVRYPSIDQSDVRDVVIAPDGDRAVASDSTETIPATTPVSQPYWLREQGTAGMFRVDDAKLIGRPENPPVFPVEYDFEVGGQTLAGDG